MAIKAGASLGLACLRLGRVFDRAGHFAGCAGLAIRRLAGTGKIGRLRRRVEQRGAFDAGRVAGADLCALALQFAAAFVVGRPAVGGRGLDAEGFIAGDDAGGLPSATGQPRRGQNGTRDFEIGRFFMHDAVPHRTNNSIRARDGQDFMRL